MELPIDSVSGWETALEFCTIQHLSLLPGMDLEVSPYPLILLLKGKLIYNGL